MGDFDRVQVSGEKSDSKKIGMMVVLALVLVGVLAFHFTKAGPQVASASPGGIVPGVATPIAPGESPEIALSKLQEDPTASLLLQGTVTDDPMLAKMPRNPFSMSSAWVASLTKVTELPPEPVKPHVVEPVHTPTVMKAPLVPLKIEDYKLNLITTINGKITASVNNKLVTIGMLVDKARVVDISTDSVTLQNTESPEAPPIVLSQRPQMR